MSISLELLRKFCSSDESRRAIMEPFSEEQWTYATDGRVIVRVPRMAEMPEVEEAPKNIDRKIWRDHPPLADWQDLPAYPKPGEHYCGICEGHGVHKCSCGDTHQCINCNGSGVVPEPSIGVQVGRQYVSNYYLHLLSELPNVKISESAVDELHALSFMFDGGEGILMPFRTNV